MASPKENSENSGVVHISRSFDDACRTRADYVARLKPGSRIHLSGICGTGMAAVAELLKSLGFQIQGSDKAFYPPMGEIVRNLTDKLFEGYAAENLDPAPDLVVIGNSLSRGNPEVEEVLSKKIPYASMPEVFHAILVGSREFCPTSIVIGGTHGKTTTTAIVATMFESATRHPGLFIGGAPLNFASGIRAVDKSRSQASRVVVLEGDEYDSAFFAKFAKFQAYRPDIFVITSLEFDHGDIYNSIEEIEAQFSEAVKKIPATGTVLIFDGYERLKALAKSWQRDAAVKAKILFYGNESTSDYRLLETSEKSSRQILKLSLNGEVLTVETELSGRHNAWNCLVAAAVGIICKLTDAEISTGIAAYRGTKRRQQIVYNDRGITIIEDFAHHPTAVAETLAAIASRYPGKRIIAVYEPRSNTSRRHFFQKQYESSFDPASLVILRDIETFQGFVGVNEDVRTLDVPALMKALTAKGKSTQTFKEVSEIKDYLLTNLQSDDVAVVMSNGDFGGLLGEVVEGLRQHSTT